MRCLYNKTPSPYLRIIIIIRLRRYNIGNNMYMNITKPRFCVRLNSISHAVYIGIKYYILWCTNW